MINTSNEYKNNILSDHRQLKMKVIFNGRQEIDGHYLKNVSIHETSNGSDVLTLGTICSNSIKITMYNSQDIAYQNGNIEAFIGLEMDGQIEWIQMGTFYINEVTQDNQYEVSLEGYDAIRLLNADYTPNIIYPALLQDVVEDIAMQCHITIKQDFYDAIVIDKPMEVTCKEMMGYMASLMGKNVRMNRENELEFFWYQDRNYCIKRENQFEEGFKKTNSLITITSLTSGSEEKTLTSGTGFGISFPNPYMTQERLDQLLERFNGFSYTPCSVKWRGDPSLEVCDLLQVEETPKEEVRCVIMGNVISFDGGMSSLIECVGQDEKEVSMSKSPTEIKLKRLYNTLLNSYKDMTEKILGHQGGYYSVDNDEDGYPSGWTIMDTPSLRNDTHLWKMSMGGFGYSDDGGQTFKNFAFDLNGNFTANAITTGVLEGEKFELDLQTGFVRIGNRNQEGIIDDVYFSFDENGLFLRSLNDLNDRVDKNASNISQINLNLDGIKSMVRQVQETLVSINNYFISLAKIVPLVDEQSPNGYEVDSESLILITVQEGGYEFSSRQNFIDSYSKSKIYSTAIDLNLISDDKEKTETIQLIIGDQTKEVVLTTENSRFILENIDFSLSESYKILVSNGGLQIAIHKMDLIEGDVYVESKVGLQEISTEVNQTGNTIEFVKKGLNKIVDDLGNYVSQSDLEEFIRFDGAKITLGAADSSFSTIITNSKISFYDGDNEVAYISNNALHIEDAIINHSLAIGSFSWRPRRNGNLSLLKIK